MELDTQEAKASLRFDAVGKGRKQAVVVTAIAPGCEAYERGVRPGHQVLAISDPVRNSEMWDLGDMSSGRFVRDALKLRASPTVNINIDTSTGLRAALMGGVRREGGWGVLLE